MTTAPVKVPALPAPAIARPTMKAAEVGAAAQRIEPISKSTTTVMNVHFEGKKVCRAMGQQGGRERVSTYIDFAHGQLEGAEGEQVCGLIPGYVAKRVELI